MKRLGIDIGAIGGEPPKLGTADNCPGALLRITRYDYDQYTARGERFQTPRQDIPFNAYGSVRVRCTGHVAQIPKTASGAVQHYGLCHSCAGLEFTNRDDLAKRQKVER